MIYFKLYADKQVVIEEEIRTMYYQDNKTKKNTYNLL